MPDRPVPIVKALVAVAVIVPDAPKATVEPLNVTELLVKLPFAMLDSVLLEPLIVLLVRVSDPANVDNVPVVGKVTAVVAVAVRVVAKAPEVVRLPPSVIVLLVFATPVPPLAPSKTPETSDVLMSIASQLVSVPLDLRYLPLALVCTGARALNAALAVVWPVPPLAIGKVPVKLAASIV